MPVTRIAASVDWSTNSGALAWIGARKSIESFEFAGHTVPGRAYVNYSSWVSHHLPHVFPMFSGLIPRAKAAFETVTRFAARNQKVPAPTPSPSARVIEIPTRK